MQSLETLNLLECTSLQELPEVCGDMQRLTELTLGSTGIREMPSSIGNLSGLTGLYLSGCEDLVSLPDSLCNLMNLQRLSLGGCEKLEKLAENIGDLQELEELHARETAISDCGTVSSEQVNVFLQHFRRACIQCAFHQRDSFLIFFPDQVRIPELFDYDRFINQKEISIDLNPSWYTYKFMGFWISYGPTRLNTILEATLVCKSDPERKYSCKYCNIPVYSRFEYPSIYCIYIPFETLWQYASGNKQGKNPNDYYMLELSEVYWLEEEPCWGIRLEYEKEAMSDAKDLELKEVNQSSI